MLSLTTCHLNHPFSCPKFPGQLSLMPYVTLPNAANSATLQHDKYLATKI